jgi:predicted metalloprotease
VQNLLGILPKVQQQRDLSRTEASRMQRRVELQADCFAGIWAAKADQQWKLIEPGDVEAAMRTAAAVGDDRLQRQAQGYVTPDSFPTARPSSANAGSRPDSRPARSGPAIPLRRTRSCSRRSGVRL